MALKGMDEIEKSKVLKLKVRRLIEVVEVDPFRPPCKKLSGNLSVYFSRRITQKHRFVYMVMDNEVKIVSVWSHYEDL